MRQSPSSDQGQPSIASAWESLQNRRKQTIGAEEQCSVSDRAHFGNSPPDSRCRPGKAVEERRTDQETDPTQDRAMGRVTAGGCPPAAPSCGRNAHCYAPPRAAPDMVAKPSGSYLGWLTANRWSGHGWRMDARGHRISVMRSNRFQSKRARWDRRRNARVHRPNALRIGTCTHRTASPLRMSRPTREGDRLPPLLPDARPAFARRPTSTRAPVAVPV